MPRDSQQQHGTAVAGSSRVIGKETDGIEAPENYVMNDKSIRKAERLLRWRSFWRGFAFLPSPHACDFIAEFWRVVAKYDSEEDEKKRARKVPTIATP